MEYLWGIDLGGTKIEGAIIKPGKEVETLARLRLPTESSKGYQHIINQIKAVVDQLSEQTGIKPTSLGIGTPGVTEPATGLMKNSNTTCLNGKPLGKDLEAALGIPVRLANDANCFALAEATLGAVPAQIPNAKVVFGVILGTGVGGGVVINGQILEGLHGIGGEWGHNFLDESGGLCYCGNVGCVERIIAGPSLERWYVEQGGSPKSLKDIVTASRLPQPPDLAKRTIQRLCEMFGKSIVNIINVLDPDAIVLGGGVGNIDELYTLGQQNAEKLVFNHELKTPFLKPALGDSAGVFGAAMLWSK